jgi:biopolymer transport protein ExbD
MQIERQVRRTRSVPMTPLIDVVFLLLIFFMLSTSFVRTESLELALPPLDQVQKSGQKVLQIYITREGYMYVGHTPVNFERLIKTLQQTLQQRPNLNVLLLSGEGVKVQQLVKVMDHIYMAGAQNLSVASWKAKKNQD